MNLGQLIGELQMKADEAAEGRALRVPDVATRAKRPLKAGGTGPRAVIREILAAATQPLGAYEIAAASGGRVTPLQVHTNLVGMPGVKRTGERRKYRYQAIAQ